jgi:hypothetical protein
MKSTSTTNTDDEQKSDDVETRQDQGFFDNLSQEEEQGVHASCDNMRLDTEDAATERPARDEPEFLSEKKKTRSERRALTALPERGMAEAVRKVADYFYKAPYGLPTPNRLVTPYCVEPTRTRAHEQPAGVRSIWQRAALYVVQQQALAI